MDIEIGIRFDVQSKKAFYEHEHAQKLAKFEAKKRMIKKTLNFEPSARR